VDAEWLDRQNKRLGRALREAKLRLPNACIEDLDYPARRQLDRTAVRQLATCAWVGQHHNVVITGPTGVGKTYLACALAQQACRKGYRALYRRVSRLFDELALARADGTYPRLLTRLARIDVLVLDDWGLAPRPMPSAGICSRSSRTATATAPRSSPASSPSRTGTTISATRPSPMPSAIACSTTPTRSCYKGPREERDHSRKTEPTSVAPLRSRWPIGVFTMSEMRTAWIA